MIEFIFYIPINSSTKLVTGLATQYIDSMQKPIAVTISLKRCIVLVNFGQSTSECPTFYRIV